MTADNFRKLALSLPEAVEASHMNHPDFRVRGKIFATLWPDNTWGMVKLTIEQQQLFMAAHPDMFEAIPGGWGRKGATKVRLRAATAPVLRRALAAAWRNAAPRALASRFEGA